MTDIAITCRPEAPTPDAEPKTLRAVCAQVKAIWSDIGPAKDWSYSQGVAGYLHDARYQMEARGLRAFANPMGCRTR